MPAIHGEDHYRARLTREQVLQIREELARDGTSFSELGRRYGVTYHAIRHIARGMAWRRIDEPRPTADDRRPASGYRGVHWHSSGPYRWEVTLVHKGKVYDLGCTDDPAEGARRYNWKARELGLPAGRLNLPDEVAGERNGESGP